MGAPPGALLFERTAKAHRYDCTSHLDIYMPC